MLGERGVIADTAPTDLPPNAFTDAMNARFVEGRVFKMGGNAPVSYTDEDKSKTFLSLQSVPFDFYSAGNSFIIAGTENALYKLENGRIENVSHLEAITTKKATSVITVHPKVKSITINQDVVNLKPGASADVTLSFKPNTVIDGNSFVWVADNTTLVKLTVDPTDSKKCKITIPNTVNTVATVQVTAYDFDREVSDTMIVNIISPVCC